MITSLRRRVLRYRIQRRQFFQAKKRGAPLYGRWFFEGREIVLHAAAGAALTLFFAFFFYRSFWALLFLWPLGVKVYLTKQKEEGERVRAKLEAEFKDCILSVSANLRAGYSVENAFLESEKDVESLYGKKGLMAQELKKIRSGLSNNIPLEQLLADLGARSGCENIREFGEVFSIARKSGGNMPEVIQSTVNLIGQEINMRQELRIVVSGRVLEQKIMNVIPFLLAGYVNIGNPGFFDVLYHNPTGWLVMSACMGVYLLSYGMSGRICRSIL